MALGRKKSSGRKEPLFGLAASLSELRLGPQDRVPNSDSKPKKSPAKSKPDDDGDEPAPERKPRASRSGAKRRSKGRGRLSIARLSIMRAGIVVTGGAAMQARPLGRRVDPAYLRG